MNWKNVIMVSMAVAGMGLFGHGMDHSSMTQICVGLSMALLVPVTAL